jgi:hypothetical protein
MRARFFFPLILLMALLLASCEGGVDSPESTNASTPGADSTASPQATEPPVYDVPSSIGHDAIPPIYEPRFVSASASGYASDELVMGVALNGAAKAYPVGLLNWREMVNDELGGVPILVAW